MCKYVYRPIDPSLIMTELLCVCFAGQTQGECIRDVLFMPPQRATISQQSSLEEVQPLFMISRNKALYSNTRR